MTYALVAVLVLLAQPGRALFTSAAELLSQIQAAENPTTIAQHAVAYESTLLGITPDECREEMARRIDVMIESVHLGLDETLVEMPLISPTAGRILDADRRGVFPLGGYLDAYRSPRHGLYAYLQQQGCGLRRVNGRFRRGACHTGRSNSGPTIR